MTAHRLDRRFLLRAGLAAGLGLGLAGCESMQDIGSLFERKQPPIPGDRQAVFPEGVPGIDRSIAQPANAPPDLAQPSAPPAAEPPPAEQQPRRRGRAAAN